MFTAGRLSCTFRSQSLEPGLRFMRQRFTMYTCGSVRQQDFPQLSG